MTEETYYVFKAFKNNRWYNYSEKYTTSEKAFKWLRRYRLKVGYTLQKELKLIEITRQNESLGIRKRII